MYIFIHNTFFWFASKSNERDTVATLKTGLLV